MNLISTITRTLYVVDCSLRKEFPEDFYKRCMYAAFGSTALLQDAGYEANIVGGDFLAFVVAKSEQRAGLQGFGLGTDQPSHFWVEVDNTIVDVGPHYLPEDSRFPAASLAKQIAFVYERMTLCKAPTILAEPTNVRRPPSFHGQHDRYDGRRARR
jgi:hypothetical protein